MNLTGNPIGNGSIQWPPLSRGVLLKRYKRFLADVMLDSGEMITAHCPNSGSMKGCSEPERPVYVSFHDNPKRKLKYTWQLIEMPTSLVGVNTSVPNRLVSDSISAGLVEELSGYSTVKTEVKVGEHSRLDILLESAQRRSCYVEVKNCTLVEKGIAMFPDAVTQRGQKHLGELMDLAASGFRCAMFFLVQRMDADSFRPADQIDPVYGQKLRQAVENGVEILVYDVHIDLDLIGLNRKLSIDMGEKQPVPGPGKGI